MKRLILLTLLCWVAAQASATNYYIDFANGNDSNTGTSEASAWKHAPGDENATANAAGKQLLSGDTLFFKGGVYYRGNIKLNYSGDTLNPIVYVGDQWGSDKAIIDGSEQISGWTALNDSIYYATIPDNLTNKEHSASFNVHEFNATSGKDEFMWTAQWPNPTDWFFYDEHDDFQEVAHHNITRTSITDAAVFNQSDPNYWLNSSLLIWTNPNRVVERRITSYNPINHTVYFDSLHATAIYEDERDQGFAIYNSHHALDKPGEYFISFSEKRIYTYPKNAANIDQSISVSAREYGFDLAKASHITIEGFIIQKHSGEGLRSGIGIGSFSSYDPKSNIVIRDNLIRHNRHHDRGYGGIFLSGVSNSVVHNNTVEDNFQQRGIFGTAGKNLIVSHNTINRSGSTSIGFYNVQNSQIIYNEVLESKGGHANGITVYIASKDILVAGNKVIDCASPITFQDGGNIYFFNNLVYSKENPAGINEWNRTNRGPWDHGEIVFVNNTLITTPGKSALNIENSLNTIYLPNDTILPNTYFSYNNIIDAGGGNRDTERDYNLYTSLSWNQAPAYDWYPAENEVVEDDMSLIFSNVATGDFSIEENSLAAKAGTDVIHLLPVDKFPDFDFYTDIDGKPRPHNEPWSLGAYELQAEEVITLLEKDGQSAQDLKRLNVYPNPTTGIIHIADVDLRHWALYNTTGEKLLQSTAKECDLRSLTAGMYILIGYNHNGKMGYEKIILK